MTKVSNNARVLLIILIVGSIVFSLIPPNRAYLQHTKHPTTKKVDNNEILAKLIVDKIAHIDSTQKAVDKRCTDIKIIQKKNKQLYQEVVLAYKKKAAAKAYVKDTLSSYRVILTRDTTITKRKFFGLFKTTSTESISDTLKF